MNKNVTSISYARTITLELRRGLTEKRFWVALGLSVLYLVLQNIMHCIQPLSMYYVGLDNLPLKITYFTITKERLFFHSFSASAVFCSFFPFFAVFAYGHSKIDDRRNRYSMQLVGRIGYQKYFVAKGVATTFLGGLFCGAVSFLDGIAVYVFYYKNWFIRDAVSFLEPYSRERGGSSLHFDVFFLNHPLGTIATYWRIVFYVSFIFLFSGLVYALLGFVVSQFVENKILLYAFPVLFSQFWDRAVYLLDTAYYRKYGVYAGWIGRFFLKTQMPGCNDLFYLCVLAMIFSILIFIIIWTYPKIEENYREGAGI